MLHDESKNLIASILNSTSLNLDYFKDMYKQSWSGKLESTLLGLKDILQTEFKVMEIIKGEQLMNTYKLSDLLLSVSQKHYHIAEKCKSAHEESLLSHLVGAMLISTNDALLNNHNNPYVVALTALFHDIGKITTCQTVGPNENRMVAFYFHAEMGCGIMSLCYFENSLISKEEWDQMCLAIQFHMCTYHSNYKDLKNDHQNATLQLLPLQVRIILYHLSIGDKIARFPLKPIQSWLNDREQLKSNSFDALKYFSEYSKRGILIQVLGTSASGKSTLVKYIINSLHSTNVVVFQRDLYMCKAAAKVMDVAIPYKVPTGEEYRNFYNTYEKHKLGAIVNQNMKKDIQLALINKDIVIVDTVALLYNPRDTIPEICAGMFKFSIYVLRDQFITTADADRYNSTLEFQIKSFGERSVMNWLPRKVNYKFLQMAGNFYSSSSMTNALKSNSIPLLSLVIKWGNESFLAPFLSFIDQLNVINAESGSSDTAYDSSLDLTDVVNKLYSLYGLDFLINFFKGLNIIVYRFGESVILIKYLDHCRYWRAKWARQCRGTAFMLGKNKKWTCIKSLLQRGCEILTRFHEDDQITTSQDYNLRDTSHLDDEQQDTIDKMLNNKPIDGLLSSKVDGSLLGITVIPNHHQLFKPFQDYMLSLNRPTIDLFVNKSSLFLVVPSSQGTVVMGEAMEDWYISSLVVGLGYCTEIELKSHYESKLTLADVLNKYIDELIADMALFYDKNASSFDKIISLSFESVCPNRQSLWGSIHKELTISYDRYTCKLLGCTFDIGSTCGIFKPSHQLILLPSWEQPIIWEISNSNQIGNMIRDVENIIYATLTLPEFFIKYPPIHAGDGSIDLEGFVFFKLLPNGAIDYSKIKTLVYYHAHKPNRKTIHQLMKVGPLISHQMPTVLLMHRYFDNLESKLISTIKDIQNEFKNPESVKELNEKAQESYDRQNTATQARMLLNSNDSFLEKVKSIFMTRFEDLDCIDLKFFKKLAMEMAIWELDSAVVKDLCKNEGDLLFLFYMEILKSQSSLDEQ